MIDVVIGFGILFASFLIGAIAIGAYTPSDKE